MFVIESNSAKAARKMSVLTAIMFFLTALLFSSPSIATNDVEKARLAHTMWSAFQCSAFAEMSGDKKEEERLFLVGLKAGREFLEAAKNGEISPEDANKVVAGLFPGPSTDFILGRIFQGVASDVYDGIMKKDEDGVWVEMSKWMTNPSGQQRLKMLSTKATAC